MNAPLPTAPNSAAATTTHPAEIKAALDDDLLDEIYEGLRLAKSYIESMMLATVRGDRQELSCADARSVSYKVRVRRPRHAQWGRAMNALAPAAASPGLVDAFASGLYHGRDRVAR